MPSCARRVTMLVCRRGRWAIPKSAILRTEFGETYAKYVAEVPAFIPYQNRRFGQTLPTAPGESNEIKALLAAVGGTLPSDATCYETLLKPVFDLPRTSEIEQGHRRPLARVPPPGDPRNGMRYSAKESGKIW